MAADEGASRATYAALSDAEVQAQHLELERTHVHDVYNVIAKHFSSTRYKGWPRVTEFIKGLTHQCPGAVLLDVGCGNGKYYSSVSEGAYWIGSDYCVNLLKDAQLKKKGCEVLRDDILKLAVKSSSVDVTIAIAVLHHISTHERRVQAISELMRVTRPGGRVLVYTMAREQLPGSIGGRDFGELKNIYLPWKLHGDEGIKEMLRFCHLSDPEELENVCRAALCESTRGDKIESIYYDSNNWAIILSKGIKKES